MEYKVSEQNILSKDQSEGDKNPTEGHLSKSKQLLKKCINQMGPIREKGVQLPTSALYNRTSQKIAAPKPVRARQITLNHHGNSKWLQTSPIKNEITLENSDLQNTKDDSSKCEISSLEYSDLAEVKRLTFQNEQKLSQVNDFKKMKHSCRRNNSPMSELQSLMEAEQELSAIFSRTKEFSSRTAFGFTSQQQLMPCNGSGGDGQSSLFSPNISYSSVSCSSSNGLGGAQSTTEFKNSVGFSNFGHFRAPIKRPSCNPIVKDERFKRLNTVNEGNNNQGFQERPGGAIPCNSQVLINPQVIKGDFSSVSQSNCLLSPFAQTQQHPFMFAFNSHATSPTAYSSGMNPFSFTNDPNLTTSSAAAGNLSFLNGSIQHHNFNNQQQNTAAFEQSQQQLQCQSFYKISQQSSQQINNIANSAPESKGAYLCAAQQQFAAAALTSRVGQPSLQQSFDNHQALFKSYLEEETFNQ